MGFKRISSLETVVKGAECPNFFITIKRIVPTDSAAHVIVSAYYADDTGNYDPSLSLLEIEGIDVADIHALLDAIKSELSSMTGIHG